MVQIAKSVPDFAREPEAFHAGSGEPVFELLNAALGIGEAVNNAADQHEEGGSQNPEANSNRRFHIYASNRAIARRFCDRRFVSRLRKCHAAEDGRIAVWQQLENQPGCRGHSRLPIGGGQPLITGMVNDFPIHGSFLPAIRSQTLGNQHSRFVARPVQRGSQAPEKSGDNENENERTI